MQIASTLGAKIIIFETFNTGGNVGPISHGQIWSGPPKLLLPALVSGDPLGQ